MDGDRVIALVNIIITLCSVL